MSTSVLQEVYRAIVIGKLCYTSSALPQQMTDNTWMVLFGLAFVKVQTVSRG